MSDPEEINCLMEKIKNQFGGKWTKRKIQVFIKYLKAYLQIMSKYHFELIYFDGFAGCGEIEPNQEYASLIEGVASEVLKIDKPVSFDIYYLVDKEKSKIEKLESELKSRYPEKAHKIFGVAEDCNKKLVALSAYISKNREKRRALAFIDPFGMQVNWESIKSLEGLGVDIWLLFPTGAVNRMLTRKGEISDSWIKKLESFLGISQPEIRTSFYSITTAQTLFGEETHTTKVDQIFDRIIACYQSQLGTIWKFVSKPMPLVNSKGSVIFHFILASQYEPARKIANEIIKKELSIPG